MLKIEYFSGRYVLTEQMAYRRFAIREQIHNIQMEISLLHRALAGDKDPSVTKFTDAFEATGNVTRLHQEIRRLNWRLSVDGNGIGPGGQYLRL
jgi:hypothetical protein